MCEPWALFTWEEVAACRFAAYMCDSPCLQICICVDPFCSFETSCLIGSYWLCPLLPGPQGWDRVCPWELSPQQTKPKSQRGSFLSSLAFWQLPSLFRGSLLVRGVRAGCYHVRESGFKSLVNLLAWIQDSEDTPARWASVSVSVSAQVWRAAGRAVEASVGEAAARAAVWQEWRSRPPGRGPSAPAVRPWAALSPSLGLPRALRPPTGPLTAWPRRAPARLWVLAHRALSPGRTRPSCLPGPRSPSLGAGAAATRVASCQSPLQELYQTWAVRRAGDHCSHTLLVLHIKAFTGLAPYRPRDWRLENFSESTPAAGVHGDVKRLELWLSGTPPDALGITASSTARSLSLWPAPCLHPAPHCLLWVDSWPHRLDLTNPLAVTVGVNDTINTLTELRGDEVRFLLLLSKAEWNNMNSL